MNKYFLQRVDHQIQIIDLKYIFDLRGVKLTIIPNFTEVTIYNHITDKELSFGSRDRDLFIDSDYSVKCIHFPANTIKPQFYPLVDLIDTINSPSLSAPFDEHLNDENIDLIVDIFDHLKAHEYCLDSLQILIENN